jgi:hypothetical protein
VIEVVFRLAFFKIFRGLGPDERLRSVVPAVDEAPDFANKFADGMKVPRWIA